MVEQVTAHLIAKETSIQEAAQRAAREEIARMKEKDH